MKNSIESLQLVELTNDKKRLEKQRQLIERKNENQKLEEEIEQLKSPMNKSEKNLQNDLAMSQQKLNEVLKYSREFLERQNSLFEKNKKLEESRFSLMSLLETITPLLTVF